MSVLLELRPEEHGWRIAFTGLAIFDGLDRRKEFHGERESENIRTKVGTATTYPSLA